MRLIDADAYKALHCKKCPGDCGVCDFVYGYGKDNICGLIDQAPTIDAVAVVRCKDCKNGELVPDFDGLYSCRGKRKPLHDPDDFCNFGVKREDG